ncbi:TPA: molybdopterin-dependent oxidoreductase [Escherichia coli]|nr:molybdopterin-dependent oxidoreductase [Escherichia coli]
MKKKIESYQGAAGGWGAVKSVANAVRKQMDIRQDVIAMFDMNKPEGFDCPGCAWPDPKHSASFDICENGAKAIAWEVTDKQVNASFFAENTVQSLLSWGDHELEAAGRLTQPLKYDAVSDCYKPLSWQQAFDEIGARLQSYSDPNQVEFYTSGRTSNEAAFLYQLFAREYGSNNFPDCSNMCHEPTSVGLAASIGVGKGTVLLEDFEKCDLVICIGHNPGTNHPRMLTSLRALVKRGAKIMQYWTAVRNIIDDTNEVTIDLSGLNLTTQPPGLQNFTAINLDNNQLTHFDATNYDRLVKLSLNSNALESINFPQGRNVSITHISMNNNALRNIDIDRLSSVTYFSAAHNQLEFVQLESCEWLQYLNLSHNQLTDIVAGNKNELLLLDLSHNKLTSLHNDLFPNLNTLLINNNLLSEIKIFYSNFCNVQTLNAANNQLKYINLDFLTYLPSIKSLRLDNNKITHIDTNNTSDIGTLFPIIKQSKNLNFLNVSGKNNCPTMQLMLFNLFSPALKLNTGLAILSPGAFEVHSDGIDVDNELFHYPIKKAYTPYNIHTYKTEEVVNQRNIKVKNMTLDEINNTYCNNDYYNQAIREEPIDLLDRSFSSSSWPF